MFEDKWLGFGNFLSLKAFGALNNGELNLLAFFQGAVAIRLNGGVMYEYVTSLAPLNEAITLGVVKPLYSSCLSTHLFRDSFQI